MIILQYITEWYSYIKSAYENDKTSYLILKSLFFIMICSVLFDNLLFIVNDYDQILPIYIIIIAIQIVLFLTAFIWGTTLITEIVCRVRVRIMETLNSQKGLMLVDSLVAVIFVSIAFVALVLTYTMATKGTTTATNRTQATYLAQQTLEKLKVQDGSSALVIPTVTTVTAGTASIPFNVAVNALPVSTITSAPNNLNTYLKPYQVVVGWSDSTGGPATNNVSMVGYYYVTP